MSESYDFHYQPTGSGAISGQQVLQQTEDAINELGDYVNDNIGGAMDVAQQALETAQNAETNAQTALDTANSFSSAIQSAQQDASTALSTAQTAQTTAGNAINLATTASQDASSAVTTANNASGQVSTLSGTVTALGQRVTTAEGNIGQNTSDITALTTRVGTAEGNITTLQNDVSIAQGNASSAMATAGTVKQQSYVLRYSSASVTDNSTIAYSTLDNTDNIKSGDKVIDVGGKIFSVVSVDTANQTVTVGSALIDLALDGNVVHTSGDETVSGYKVFENIRLSNSIKAINLENQTIDLNNCYSSFGLPQSGNISFYFCNTNDGTANISNLPEQRAFFLISQSIRILSAGSVVYLKQTLVNSNGKTFVRYCNNSVWGSWQDVTNLVTTDTAQTISGDKSFSSDLSVANVDTTANTPNLNLRNYKADRGTTDTAVQTIGFLDKNAKALTSIESRRISNGNTATNILCYNTDDSNNTVSGGIAIIKGKNDTSFAPNTDNAVNCGRALAKWSDVVTYKVNGLTPSSLSLPSGNASDVIDISSYITDLSGTVNLYTPPANGYLTFTFSSGSQIQIYSTTGSGLSAKWSAGGGAGIIRGFVPVLKNVEMKIVVNATTMDSFYFIPCQGNV